MLLENEKSNTMSGDKMRTKDVETTDFNTVLFEDMLLSGQVVEGLRACGFIKPSPIQLKAIPLGKLGLDLIVQAKSGTGKTCVFGVIALEHILASSSKALQVLILTPTREVAIQITDVIKSISLNFKGNSVIKCHSFIGGQQLKQDKAKLKACQIAVGTPGRILHLIQDNLLNTTNIRLLVLDEADKLLAPEFQDAINLIFSKLPENKQMISLSATYPSYMASYATRYMKTPTWVRLNAIDPSLRGIKQFYKITPFADSSTSIFDYKVEALIKLLSSIEFVQAIIFTNYQMKAESLCETLSEQGWPSIFISGSIEQDKRNTAMIQLKQFKCRILVSTDLTSRGIDAQNVDLVISMDLPVDAETYLHRIGRAGRYGCHGIAVSFIAEKEESTQFENIIDSYDLRIQLINENLDDVVLSRNENKQSFDVDDITVEKASINKEQLDDALLEYEKFKSNQKLLFKPHKPREYLVQSQSKAVKHLKDDQNTDFFSRFFTTFDRIIDDLNNCRSKYANESLEKVNLDKTQNEYEAIFNKELGKNLELFDKINKKRHLVTEKFNSKLSNVTSSHVNFQSKNLASNLNSIYKWQAVETSARSNASAEKKDNISNQTRLQPYNTNRLINNSNCAIHSNFLNYYSNYYKYFFIKSLNDNI